MGNFYYVFLGAVQGITEFLPVSSSGHLAVLSRLFKAKPDVFFFLTLHLGTVFSLLVFFYRDITASLRDRKVLLNIVIVTFVTGGLGFLSKDIIETFFASSQKIGAAFLLNAFILFFARQKKQRPMADLRWQDALFLGLAQTLAIIPGISRSGTTITALLRLGVKKEDAFKFSFLAAIPIIIAAFLFELKDFWHSAPVVNSGVILGFFISFIFGLASLCVLSFFVKKSRLYLFGYYSLIIGTAVIFLNV